MGKKIAYKSITRVENCICEEKIDGSSFSWMLAENGKLHFFSAKNELEKDKCDKFFVPFIEYVEQKWKELSEKYDEDMLLLQSNITYSAEAIGMAQIKYFDKNELVENRLFVYDIKGKSGQYYKRSFLVDLMNVAGLKVVPLTEFNTKESKLNPNVLREGIILRYEDISGTDDVIKLKLVERKNGKPQKITMEIKEIK